MSNKTVNGHTNNEMRDAVIERIAADCDSRGFSNKLPQDIRQAATEAIADMTVYTETGTYGTATADKNTVVLLHLNADGTVPDAMFVQMILKVPAGKITRWGDIYDFLAKTYSVEEYNSPRMPLPFMNADDSFLPYWCIVLKTGIISDDRFCSAELRRKQLLQEGVSVVQKGSIDGSYKVENYKDYLFDFDALEIVEE